MKNKAMIYIVDDAADYRYLVQQVFSRFLPEYAVRLFADGDELRRHVLNPVTPDRPQVILLDLDMPVLNGHETLVFLKQQLAWHEIPVVVMTNSLSHEDIGLYYRAGASSFMLKPTDIEQLRQNLDTICRYWTVLNRLPEQV